MPILDFEKILKALHKEHAQFILVGGMAAISHGMNYITDDADLCYKRSKENYRALVKALNPARPRLRTPQGELPFLFDEKTLENGLNFTLVSDWGSLDLLGELSGLGGYDQLILRATQFELYGISVNTISLDDLIKAKQLAGRTKDKLHLLELEAIKEIQGKK